MQYEANFLDENVEVTINKYGDEILGICLPDQIVCTVAKAEDAVQGNTVNTAQKKA